ncbi:hypothetical protein CFP56_007847 [Quercus suber]|uniref:Uncharacterized protein n=1 Tax=Quercus suber TaxID=58331 RepID=A0AAW0L6W3_QUESU
MFTCDICGKEGKGVPNLCVPCSFRFIEVMALSNVGCDLLLTSIDLNFLELKDEDNPKFNEFIDSATYQKKIIINMGEDGNKIATNNAILDLKFTNEVLDEKNCNGSTLGCTMPCPLYTAVVFSFHIVNLTTSVA